MTSKSRRLRRISKSGKLNPYDSKTELKTYFEYNPITGLNYYSGINYVV